MTVSRSVALPMVPIGSATIRVRTDVLTLAGALSGVCGLARPPAVLAPPLLLATASAVAAAAMTRASATPIPSETPPSASTPWRLTPPELGTGPSAALPYSRALMASEDNRPCSACRSAGAPVCVAGSQDWGALTAVVAGWRQLATAAIPQLRAVGCTDRRLPARSYPRVGKTVRQEAC